MDTRKSIPDVCNQFCTSADKLKIKCGSLPVEIKRSPKLFLQYSTLQSSATCAMALFPFNSQPSEFSSFSIGKILILSILKKPALSAGSKRNFAISSSACGKVKLNSCNSEPSFPGSKTLLSSDQSASDPAQ